MATQFKVWDGLYREAWGLDGSGCLMAKTHRLVFDGGVDHKDGAHFKIARPAGVKTIFMLQASHAAIPNTKISLGCLGYTDGECCDNEQFNDSFFVKELDLSTARCTQTIGCAPWFCGPEGGCAPKCCAPVANDCEPCPADPHFSGLSGTGDIILTLHGTPSRCSTLYLTFYYS